MLQVVALALRYPTYNFTAWSDSASALKSIQTWLDDISVDGGLGELEDLRCFPLGQRPNNLLLRKVQAHTELASLPNSSLMPAIGNWVADIAAKAAEANDLPCIKETATDIVHWPHLQSENLFMFCQYLIEVTKAVAELKRVHQHRRDEICLESSCDPTDWVLLQPSQEGCTCVDLPWHLPPGKKQYQWPTWHLQSLMDWCRLLQWPAPSEEWHAISGVTFLELLVNYVVCSGRLPPVPLQEAPQREYVDPLTAEGILCPIILRETVVAFVATVKALDKLCGCQTWPSPRHHRIHCLSFLGVRDGRKGLLIRPVFPRANETARLLGKVLENDCGEHLRTFAPKQCCQAPNTGE